MRIVIDARMMAPRWTGIGLYVRNLVAELQRIDHDNQYFVLLDPEMFDHWQPSSPNFTKVLAPYKIYGFGEQLLLPFKLRMLRPDLVHFLHFNVPVLYKKRRISTIHDTTLLEYNISPGGLLSTIKYAIMQPAKRWAFGVAVSSNAVITPSQATKDAIIKRYGSHLSDRIHVTHEAINVAHPLKTRKLDATNPRLLYVGTFYPYKNLGLLVQAWPQVIAKHPTAKLTLIGDTPRFRAALQNKINALGVADSISLPGFVSDAERQAAYQQASLFVFPSLSEGFGLPPLEAMAAGLPVVAARASCLPEVLGQAAEFFDPPNPDDLANKINALLDNPDRMADLQAAGYKHLGQFSWATMATQTLEVYNLLETRT